MQKSNKIVAQFDNSFFFCYNGCFVLVFGQLRNRLKCTFSRVFVFLSKANNEVISWKHARKIFFSVSPLFTSSPLLLRTPVAIDINIIY